MAGINLPRVAAGGVVAAVIVVVGALLSDMLFGGAVTEAIAAVGGAAPQGKALVALLAIFLIGGLAMVWLYAAVRPRYGPGPVTALRVGLAVWLFGVAGPNAALEIAGVIPTGVFFIQALTALVYVNVAAIAGAGLYAEAPAGGEDAAPASPAAAAVQGGSAG